MSPTVRKNMKSAIEANIEKRAAAAAASNSRTSSPNGSFIFFLFVVVVVVVSIVLISWSPFVCPVLRLTDSSHSRR